MGNSLKQKAASGMVWTAFQKYSKMLIQFVSGIILARLLTPYDYGCIGMLSIFMVLAESFIDGGFGSALIQKKRPTQVDYSTIFWWNMGMAVFMYAILYVCAPAISRFYETPLLCDVLRVQGIVLFIYALNVIQRNQLRKKLNFKLLSIVSISTAIIALCITVVMAYRGLGVWALVAQNLVIAAIPSLVFWFYVKWRPILTFSWKSFRELFSFGFYMFLTHILNHFGNQIQGLLIGRVYNPSTMGYYSKAWGTEKLASTSISNVMTQVTYPLYAEVQSDKEKLANMIRRLTMTLSYVTFPLIMILILCAKPIFVLLYSDRWIQSVPYFQVLCFAGIAYSLQSVNYQSIAAIGKSKEMFWWTVLKRMVGIGLVIGGVILGGMKGLLIGFVFNTWFSYFINIKLVSKHIGYKWIKQLFDILPVLTVSISFAAISYCCCSFFHFSIFIDGLLKFISFTFLYLGWSFYFKPESYTYFKTVLQPFFYKLKRRR